MVRNLNTLKKSTLYKVQGMREEIMNKCDWNIVVATVAPVSSILQVERGEWKREKVCEHDYDKCE